MRSFLILVFGVCALWAQTPQFPLTGREVPALLPYENAVRRVMEKWSIPGASLAIADGSRLIYARGLGYADREAGTPVQPLSRFRLASISKTVAGMTVLKLAEEGRINLDAPALSYIPDLKPATNPAPDPRMAQITVRQLLQHTGGFDRPIDDDYVNYFLTASRLFNEPVSNDLMTRYVISQRLDFAPGSKYVYGNSGYQILGRVIERVTGKPFVDAVYDKILRPAGVTSVELGGNLLSQRLPDEVRYYDYPGAALTTTAVAPGVVLPAPRPYNRRVDMADSYGGLVGNVVDMMRYLLALEGRRGQALLSPATLTAMVARPVPAVHPATGNYTGLTWRVIPTTGGVHWWHSGGASGTRNLMVRRLNGRSWVILMNSRPQDEDTIITELFDAMFAAEGQVRDWPTHDLFSDFSGPQMAVSAETLSFTHSLGSNPPEAQRLQVTASPGTANVAVDPPAVPWLRLDRVTGSTPVTLAASVEPAGLAPGEYRTQLRITAPNAINGPRLVTVTLRVLPAPAFSAVRSAASRLVVRSAAAESRLTLEAEEIAAEPVKAGALPEPGPLAGVTVRVTDSAGVEKQAAIVEVGPRLVDVVMPAGLAAGEAVIGVLTHKGRWIADRVEIAAVSPALFSAAGDGKGPALGTVVRTAEDGTSTTEPASQCGDDGCSAKEIDLGAETDRVELRLAATGVRGVSDPAAYAVSVGDESAEVIAVRPDETAAGVDLIVVRLARSLAGRGELDVTVTVAEMKSNAVKIRVK